MLIWMRDSAFGGLLKFFLMGLLVLAVAGLVLMDVGGFFSGNMSSSTLAKGGGVNIGAREFDRTLSRVLASQGIGASEAYKLGLVNTVLNSEIQNRLFTEEAHKMGLEIGDDEVKKQIAKLAEPLATDGRSKRDALQQILRTQNISESEFVGSVRQEMANGLLRSALQAPPTLTSPLMAETLYRYDNETRAADVVILKNAAAPDITKPTDEQLQKYYDANKHDYLIPETRTITVATLKPEMVKKKLKISDEDLKAEYDRNIASFTKPPRRLVEQVVLDNEEAANKALEDMQAGKKVENSDKQEFEREGLLPEIATPVFEAKEGAVLGPIKTALGWHVLKVEKLLPEQVTPFADVKDRLKTELENIAMTDQLYQTGNEIEDRAAGGESLENIVNEYGMTTEIIGPFRMNGNDKDGKDLFKSYGTDRDKLIQSAFDYEVGEITPIVETADSQFHILHIDQVTPDTYRPLKDVRAELQKRWMDEQRRLANTTRAQDLLAAVQGGKTLVQAAKEQGLAVQSFSSINRKSEPPAPLTAVVAAQIFATDKGNSFSSEIGDGFVVGTVTNIKLPASAAKADEKELDGLKDLTGRSLAQDILGQYISSLGGDKKIRINQPLLDQMYGGQAQ